MKQSGHLIPSEETGTGCPVTSKYGRTPPNKHGGVGLQQHVYCVEIFDHVECYSDCSRRGGGHLVEPLYLGVV